MIFSRIDTGALLVAIAMIMAGPARVLAQQSLTGKVVDASSKESLGYCHVLISSTGTGTITNEDGVFRVDDVTPQEVLVISFIGYTTKRITVAEVRSNPTIELEPQSISLDELFIYADDSYLYEAVEKCAATMSAQPRRVAKTYYSISTDINGEPNELLECYYNGTIKGGKIENLELKNGRAGLPVQADKFFLNFQSSIAIRMLDAIDRSDKYPAIPLQFKSRKIQKNWKLKRLPNLSDTSTLHLEFTAIRDPGKNFNGEMWINTTDHSLRKLILSIDNAEVYPFYSWIPTSDIGNIGFDITQNYRHDSLGVFLDNMQYTYRLILSNPKPKEELGPIKWDLKSQSLVYFYEYDTTFMLPFFEYSPSISDYRQISFIPHDSLFWASAHGFQLSDQQMERIKFFEEEGVLINYYSDWAADVPRGTLGMFEKNNIMWRADKRVKFGMNKSEHAPREGEFLSDMFNVEVQVFLDANAYDDMWAYNTATVLDIFKSYNYVGETPVRNCYTNIFFDLCEIARRELIDELISKPQTRETIEATYQAHMNDLNAVLEEYRDDVDLGMDMQGLREWNDRVKSVLNIDNIKLHGIEENGNE